MMLESMGKWIYDFQTLITGVIAVAAALYAARFAQRQVTAANEQIAVARDQITAVKEQADRERAQRLRAARATLPTTLSAICEFAQEAGQVLHAARPAPLNLDKTLPPLSTVQFVRANVPMFPYEILEALERIVELTDAEDVAERIESILREVQVFLARTRPLVDGAQIHIDAMSIHIVQAAALYARAESLFTYARRKADGVNSADLWDRVFAALAIMKIYTPEIIDEASRQRSRGLSPGEADTPEPE